MAAAAPIRMRFTAGTLEFQADSEAELHAKLEPLVQANLAKWDERTHAYRAEAFRYASIMRVLHHANIVVDDQARRYETLESGARVHREARYYQKEAIDAWLKNKSTGVVVLPTGAGKTHVAVMAIEQKLRSALVVTPTLDLVRQWYDILRSTFAVEVGIVGGGHHDVRTLTVSTYDSAYIHMEHFGNRFGLVVFDEVHHLPSGAYAEASRICLAPFRLGLSATPERSDGKEADLSDLVGDTVYRRDIKELRGEFLANYDTERVIIELSAQERQQYEDARARYRNFIMSQGINLRAPDGWAQFIQRSARSQAGRDAMRAFRLQREIAFAAPGKLEYLAHLLFQHRKERTLIFTEDNATVYKVSRRFLIPAITHQTKIKERSDILERFAKGDYKAVVTSKVLNEGVDVPAASVAVVMSGSGSVREHVQRLGRVLRPAQDKRATLYELVSAGTTETWTSQRRREHSAYR